MQSTLSILAIPKAYFFALARPSIEAPLAHSPRSKPQKASIFFTKSVGLSTSLAYFNKLLLAELLSQSVLRGRGAGAAVLQTFKFLAAGGNWLEVCYMSE